MDAANSTHLSMTIKIRAMSAVAHSLCTDLTAERCRRNQGDQDAWSFEWVGLEGGDHVVAARSLGVGLLFRVDLVTDRVIEAGRA